MVQYEMKYGPWRMIRSDSRHSCGLDRTYSELLEDEKSDKEDLWAFKDYEEWKYLKARLAVENKSQRKSSLYLIVFSLTTNRYLHSDFEDLFFYQKDFPFHLSTY